MEGSFKVVYGFFCFAFFCLLVCFLNDPPVLESFKGLLFKPYLTNKVTAPATTGDATLVPERERHPPFIPEPLTPEP